MRTLLAAVLVLTGLQVPSGPVGAERNVGNSDRLMALTRRVDREFFAGEPTTAPRVQEVAGIEE